MIRLERHAATLQLVRADPAAALIVLTAFGTIEFAVKAMQLGAVDFITKPFTGDHISVVINKALGMQWHFAAKSTCFKKEVGDR